MRQEINESVDVIAIFYAHKKTIEPFRIRRAGHSYQVKKIHTTWPVDAGEKHGLYFHVDLDSGELAELMLTIDGMNFQWKINSIDYND